MARVWSQEIPPGLIEVYRATIRNGTPSFGTHVLAAANPAARATKQEPPATPLSRFATRSAEWMLDRWLPNADRGSRSSFYRARRAEIMAGIFDANYWAEGVMFSDMSELAMPTVLPYTGTWNPAYWDETRKPTRCDYRDIAAAYPTPEENGTEEEPAPGWKGVVEDLTWRDLYHVQRRLTFELQHGITEHDGRPVAVWLEWQVESTATIRGNKNWFTLILHPIFHGHDYQHTTQKSACARWAREVQYRLSLPGDNPGGWNFTATHAETRDGRRFAEFASGGSCSWLSLRIATPPSLGIYGSRNDAVSVRNTGTARVFTAI